MEEPESPPHTASKATTNSAPIGDDVQCEQVQETAAEISVAVLLISSFIVHLKVPQKNASKVPNNVTVMEPVSPVMSTKESELSGTDQGSESAPEPVSEASTLSSAKASPVFDDERNIDSNVGLGSACTGNLRNRSWEVEEDQTA